MPSPLLEVVLPDESPTMPVELLVALARQADALGFATAWLPDHLLPPEPYGATFGGVYEPLVTIGHLSAHTTRITFGTSVLIAPLRDPFVLAKQVATLHRLSAGRVVLGLGVGWNEAEFAAVGAGFARRGAATDDALGVLRHLLGPGDGPYEGGAEGRLAFERGVFEPKAHGEVPIMIGGGSTAALRRAALFGDLWQGLPASPEEFARQASVLAGLAADQGRTVAAALRLGWAPDQSVGDVVEQVAAYAAVGAERIAVHLGEHTGAAARMQRLAEEWAAQRPRQDSNL